MKKFFAMLLALAALAGCSKNTGGGMTITPGVIKVAMEIGYPPFEYYDTDGTTPIGFDVELGREIAKRLGLEVEFIDTAWEGILAGLDSYKYDCAISAITITDERKAKYGFSEPYIGNGQSIVIRKDAPFSVSGPQDLAGRQVGYQNETTSDIFINKYADENGISFTPAEYDQVLQAFTDLRLGRVEAVVADYLVTHDYISVPDNPYQLVWQGEADEYFGVCVKQSNTELLDKINGAISEMFYDGTISEISQKIFNADLTTPTSPTL